MKAYFSLLISMLACLVANANIQTYVGSTPAHAIVRNFLQISSTDSIDFIRWKLEISSNTFKLQCQYGLAQPGTPGFSNEQRVAFEGSLTELANYYYLTRNGKSISIFKVNGNILHFLDRDNRMLIGNGGYSYALNNTHPVETKEVTIRTTQRNIENLLVFEGRTPCRDLSTLLGLNKSEACNKMKWYLLFYTDAITAKPSYFLMGGSRYRKETMTKGSWKIITGPNGRTVYQVYTDKWVRSLDLLKGDDNILFFLDSDGQPLVGNEDFSYTLNRRNEEYPRR